MKKRYIGSECYICYSSQAELVRTDESVRVSLTPKEYKILVAFVDNINKPMNLKELSNLLWGSNYDVDKKDPESIKSHISRIRNKLNKINPMLKNRLETNYGYGTYTFKADLKEPVPDTCSTDHIDTNDIEKELEDFCHRIDTLVEKLEKLQEKIDSAKNKESDIWMRVYSTQFQTTFSLLMSLQGEVRSKQLVAQELGKYRCYPASEHSGRTITCTSDAMIPIKDELTALKNWTASSIAKIDYIEAQLNEVICEYLLRDFFDHDFFENILSDLPLSREIAVALCQLTESFDGMLELYDAIFDKYTGYLTNSELSLLLDKAKKVWDPIIWKRWRSRL